MLRMEKQQSTKGSKKINLCDEQSNTHFGGHVPSSHISDSD